MEYSQDDGLRSGNKARAAIKAPIVEFLFPSSRTKINQQKLSGAPGAFAFLGQLPLTGLSVGTAALVFIMHITTSLCV